MATDVVGRLRAAGLRVTSQRTAVLEILDAAGRVGLLGLRLQLGQAAVQLGHLVPIPAQGTGVSGRPVQALPQVGQALAGQLAHGIAGV